MVLGLMSWILHLQFIYIPIENVKQRSDTGMECYGSDIHVTSAMYICTYTFCRSNACMYGWIWNILEEICMDHICREDNSHVYSYEGITWIIGAMQIGISCLIDQHICNWIYFAYFIGVLDYAIWSEIMAVPWKDFKIVTSVTVGLLCIM